MYTRWELDLVPFVDFLADLADFLGLALLGVLDRAGVFDFAFCARFGFLVGVCDRAPPRLVDFPFVAVFRLGDFDRDLDRDRSTSLAYSGSESKSSVSSHHCLQSHVESGLRRFSAQQARI
jgi:hypothetical protein